MKVLALIDVAAGANMDRVRAEIANEVRGAWDLFSSGILREAYATGSPTRVVFVFEVADVPSAEAHLRALPLVRAGLIDFQLIELRPFVNWSALFAK